MKMRFNTMAGLTALLAATAAITTPATAATDLIVNGGFEDQPGFTQDNYDYSATPFGWTTNAAWNANGANAVTGGAYGLAHSGYDSVRFGSTNNTSIYGSPTTLSQTFADVAGGIYTVAFYTYNDQYTGVSGSRPNVYLTASAGGQSISVADNVISDNYIQNAGSTYYVPESFNFTGTGSDTLSIAAVADYGYWHLDDVSVTGPALGSSPVAAVPEPAAWLTMIIGFGAVGAMMRRAYRKSEDRFAAKLRALAAA